MEIIMEQSSISPGHREAHLAPGVSPGLPRSRQRRRWSKPPAVRWLGQGGDTNGWKIHGKSWEKVMHLLLWRKIHGKSWGKTTEELEHTGAPIGPRKAPYWESHICQFRFEKHRTMKEQWWKLSHFMKNIRAALLATKGGEWLSQPASS